ncbi:MAG: hypothetical protein VX303_04310, partial [Candidatus Thermoplasmatota archaeon]|nr:hypothetical protein [Candidatus Thermoplasmatota archaeon]
ALQMGSTGESEVSCASAGEIIPNGSSSENNRIDIGRTFFPKPCLSWDILFTLQYPWMQNHIII